MSIVPTGLDLPGYPWSPEKWDVVVCGGGPAGIAAAIAAARRGKRTLLVEQLYSLGGMASQGGVTGWCDTQSGPLAEEMERRLTDLGAAERWYDPDTHLYEGGRMRFKGDMFAAVALEMACGAGVEVMFGTTACLAIVEDGGRVAGVVLAAKGKLQAVQAGVVIDATADGDIAADAGAEVMMGDPDDGRLQHVNYRYLLAGVDYAKFREAHLDAGSLNECFASARNSGELIVPAGMMRPNRETFPLEADGGRLCLTGWEIENVNPADPAAVSRCVAECQRAALALVAFVRKTLPGYEECRIERLPGLLGTRESRRIRGEYVLTKEDVISGTKFADGIARCCFFIDLHDSPPGMSIPFPMSYKRSAMPPPGDWYEIPYRCLLPAGLSGILTAGRCISCDRSAQGSMRLQPTCMYVGEAAGIGAAMAVTENRRPCSADGVAVRKEIGL